MNLFSLTLPFLIALSLNIQASEIETIVFKKPRQLKSKAALEALKLSVYYATYHEDEGQEDELAKLWGVKLLSITKHLTQEEVIRMKVRSSGLIKGGFSGHDQYVDCLTELVKVDGKWDARASETNCEYEPVWD
jgi:hypothetical protein